MKQLFVSLLLTCMTVCAVGQLSPQAHPMPVFGGNLQTPSSGCYNNDPCRILYNGGPVYEKAPTVYIIWYGDWKAKDKRIIDYYFQHLGGTTQNKINTTYADSTGKHIPNAVKHSPKNDYHDNYSLGKSINGTSAIEAIVSNAISGGHLPSDSNGIYFVLTYRDVSDGGFCIGYCGYHSPSTSIVAGKTIKFAMVGDPDKCPSACEVSTIVGDHGSPNNDPGADGATSIMWHEFSESVSDPEVNMKTAWAENFGPGCGENGDCCAYIFGTLKTDAHGHKYTNTIGTKNYIMQEMFKLTSKSRSGQIPGVCKQTF